MIAKQIKGKTFSGCLRYVLGKEGAQVIGGNVSSKSLPGLQREFLAFRGLNYKVDRPVYHTSLSVSASETIGDEKWDAIAKDYLQGMGFNRNQFLLVRHNDTEHNHVHIIASRIRLDGSCVSDSWDYPRSEKLVRQLEEKYDLQRVVTRDHERRSPTTGERRLLRRTGSQSVRQQLQDLVDQSRDGVEKLSDFVENLSRRGVEVRLRWGESQPTGISYCLDDVAISGSHLGRRYTYPGLQRQGIQYDVEGRDRMIQVAQGNPKFAVPVAKVCAGLIKSHGSPLDGRHYTVRLDERELVLERHRDNQEILRAKQEDGQWKPTRSRLTLQDVEAVRSTQQAKTNQRGFSC